MLQLPSLMFKECYGKYALAAINVWSMEQILSLFQAGQESESPFIVQMTPVALEYGSREMYLSMIKAAAQLFPDAKYAVHLDHGDFSTVKDVIATGGFSSVMIDASHEPYEKNVAMTKEIVEMAHAEGIEVEAELGVLSGVEDKLVVSSEQSSYTSPRQVEDFVSRTNCDSLAVAIGTSHGAYKFSGDQSLQFEILDEIQSNLTGFPLVLHGGSAVDEKEIARINASGGKLNSGARGVPDEEIRKAIKGGVCKVNIATDARILWTRVLREHFKNKPEDFDPLTPGRIYKDVLVDLYKKKIRLLQAIE